MSNTPILKPSQAARDAAASFSWSEGWVGTASLRHAIRNGNRDDHEAVQAFARFEQSIRADERERCAQACDDHAVAIDNGASSFGEIVDRNVASSATAQYLALTIRTGSDQ